MFGKSSLTLLSMATVDSWATTDVIGNSGKAAFFFKNDNRRKTGNSCPDRLENACGCHRIPQKGQIYIP
jgi:hypothetical protein